LAVLQRLRLDYSKRLIPMENAPPAGPITLAASSNVSTAAAALSG
jgi:hypothetical protein